MVMFALPLLDTALAFARRMVNRRAVFGADRHHFHHQLIARGLTVKQTVLVAYGLAIFLWSAAEPSPFCRRVYVVAAYLVIFGFLAVAAFKMGMIHEHPRIVTRKTLDESAVSPRGSVGGAGQRHRRPRRTHSPPPRMRLSANGRNLEKTRRSPAGSFCERTDNPPVSAATMAGGHGTNA